MDLNGPTTQLEEELDSEISSIRREIRKLQRRRRFLSSSILSSGSLQKSLKPQQSSGLAISNLNEDISPLIRAADSHTQSNHHRIAFSTTTFPFKDPSPLTEGNNTTSKDLLGVRIDICPRNGRFTKPYYILLRKLRTDIDNQFKIRLKIHRHTIPAFIPVARLERIFLPEFPHALTDSDGNRWNDTPAYGSKKKQPPLIRKQNLQGFVREIRRQLVAWHTRVGAVHFLREQLGVIRRGVDAYPDEEEDGPWDRDVLVGVDPASEIGESRLRKNELGIASLSPTALEVSYVRIEWEDGQVGRFKISNSGLVERAVVIGDGGRDKGLEAALTGGDSKVLTLLDRLSNNALSRAKV
ncbi:Cenp-O kinetochore centromere component-domain-containing protein [Aspergillus crustosus]